MPGEEPGEVRRRAAPPAVRRDRIGQGPSFALMAFIASMALMAFSFALVAVLLAAVAVVGRAAAAEGHDAALGWGGGGNWFGGGGMEVDCILESYLAYMYVSGRLSVQNRKNI